MGDVGSSIDFVLRVQTHDSRGMKAIFINIAGPQAWYPSSFSMVACYRLQNVSIKSMAVLLLAGQGIRDLHPVEVVIASHLPMKSAQSAQEARAGGPTVGPTV